MREPVSAIARGARIESLLSARLFLQPQLAGDRLFFVSNLAGHISLYSIDVKGSVQRPLLPPDVVLQNPALVDGDLFRAFPRLGQILLVLDRHGDENYQPHVVPIDGGVPEPIFPQALAGHRVHMGHPDLERRIVYFLAESRTEELLRAFRADLGAGSLVKLGESPWGCAPDGVSEDHAKAVLIDGYTAGDNVLYLWEEDAGERRLVYGRPLEARGQGEAVPPNGVHSTHFVNGDRDLLLVTYEHDDAGGLGLLHLDDPARTTPVPVAGTRHRGRGELTSLEHLTGDRYLLGYNIDGCSWLYEGKFDGSAPAMTLAKAVVGRGRLRQGVLESAHFDEAGDRIGLSFSTATSPTQLYSTSGATRRVRRHTDERLLGIPETWLSQGENATYKSFDGTRVSARMYLPPEELGFEGPRPLVYYVHGGPQSQERPDFAWFSMPLIQFLAMRGFAVFVPNVRGSSGYGMSYMKQVDRDWGGKDRLDHVHAMTKVLPKDGRVDVSRAGVVGRSYGGYMTLMLAGRHPGLWSAACDMFGPYDLVTFMDRIPETWKPYYRIAVGDPATDRDFLLERSPRAYVDEIRCPLLVIQGQNDPRVVERESRDLVEQLRGIGKDVEYLVFEDEGHDVLKFGNRVKCYTTITGFFEKHLRP